MVIMNLVDSSDYENTCGYLICENENISSRSIQKKIDEIKLKMDQDGVDWIIDDIISAMPSDWMISLYEKKYVVRI